MLYCQLSAARDQANTAKLVVQKLYWIKLREKLSNQICLCKRSGKLKEKYKKKNMCALNYKSYVVFIVWSIVWMNITLITLLGSGASSSLYLHHTMSIWSGIQFTNYIIKVFFNTHTMQTQFFLKPFNKKNIWRDYIGNTENIQHWVENLKASTGLYYISAG